MPKMQKPKPVYVIKNAKHDGYLCKDGGWRTSGVTGDYRWCTKVYRGQRWASNAAAKFAHGATRIMRIDPDCSIDEAVEVVFQLVVDSKTEKVTIIETEAVPAPLEVN